MKINLKTAFTGALLFLGNRGQNGVDASGLSRVNITDSALPDGIKDDYLVSNRKGEYVHDLLNNAIKAKQQQDYKKAVRYLKQYSGLVTAKDSVNSELFEIEQSLLGRIESSLISDIKVDIADLELLVEISNNFESLLKAEEIAFQQATDVSNNLDERIKFTKFIRKFPTSAESLDRAFEIEKELSIRKNKFGIFLENRAQVNDRPVLQQQNKPDNVQKTNKDVVLVKKDEEQSQGIKVSSIAWAGITASIAYTIYRCLKGQNEGVNQIVAAANEGNRIRNDILKQARNNVLEARWREFRDYVEQNNPTRNVKVWNQAFANEQLSSSKGQETKNNLKSNVLNYRDSNEGQSQWYQCVGHFVFNERIEGIMKKSESNRSAEEKRLISESSKSYNTLSNGLHSIFNKSWDLVQSTEEEHGLSERIKAEIRAVLDQRVNGTDAPVLYDGTIISLNQSQNHKFEQEQKDLFYDRAADLIFEKLQEAAKASIQVSAQPRRQRDVSGGGREQGQRVVERLRTERGADQQSETAMSTL